MEDRIICGGCGGHMHPLLDQPELYVCDTCYSEYNSFTGEFTEYEEDSEGTCLTERHCLITSLPGMGKTRSVMRYFDKSKASQQNSEENVR